MLTGTMNNEKTDKSEKYFLRVTELVTKFLVGARAEGQQRLY